MNMAGYGIFQFIVEVFLAEKEPLGFSFWCSGSSAFSSLQVVFSARVIPHHLLKLSLRLVACPPDMPLHPLFQVRGFALAAKIMLVTALSDILFGFWSCPSDAIPCHLFSFA